MAEIQHWRGFAELEQNLMALGTQLHERGVKRMMSRAAVPMRDDARRRAPVLVKPDARRRPGTVRNAIRIWRKRGTRYAATYYVGVRALSRRQMKLFKQNSGRSGANNPNDPFYWRFLEFEVGRPNYRAQPFLRPAFEAKKLESVRVALEEGRAFVRSMRFKRIAAASGASG